MAKFEINTEVFYQRSKILAEATYALTRLALSGHDHCNLGNNAYHIQLTAYSHSATEAQETECSLRELLSSNWHGEINSFTEEEPYFWTTIFTYDF